MSFMAVFDQDGRCKYVLDGDPESIDVSSEAAVVYMDQPVDPNSVWYSHATGLMQNRSPFRVLVSTNKIEGIPAGTTVHVGSEAVVVDEGSIEFEVDYPQTVKALLMHVRHTDTEMEVPCEVAG